MQEIRANTAVDVLIGPFLDSTDGDTAETALTISQADVRLSKNGQNIAQKNDATAAVHDELGYYNCELDATDTNTLGQLVLAVHETGALAVRHEYMVLTEAAWDAKYADGMVSHQGTAQAGAAGSVTLATSASAVLDYYRGGMARIIAGTGAGQSGRFIHAYSTGRLASIAPDWITNPDATSVVRVEQTAPANTTEPMEANVTQAEGTDWSTALDARLDNRIAAASLATAAQIIALNNADTDLMPTVNTAFTYQFSLIDSSGDPATGITVTRQRIIDGGIIATGTGTVTEVSGGVYEYAASAADMNGGAITHIFSGAGAKTAFVHLITTSGV